MPRRARWELASRLLYVAPNLLVSSLLLVQLPCYPEEALLWLTHSPFSPKQGQSLYQSLQLALPPSDPTTPPIALLVWGGATATGLLGIQLARLSGVRVLATASSHNHELLKSLGATAVFDYRSPTVVADIRAAAAGPLRLAWDCVASTETARLCAEALDREGGEAVYSSLLPVKEEVLKEVNPAVKGKLTFAYTALGEDFEKSIHFPAVPADLEFGRMLWDIARGLLAKGDLKVAPVILDRGGKGLEGVLVGLRELKEGKVSAGKLVYSL